MDPEIEALQKKRNELELQVFDVESEIGRLQRQCQHVRADFPDAWWCEKCGGEMDRER